MQTAHYSINKIIIADTTGNNIARKNGITHGNTSISLFIEFFVAAVVQKLKIIWVCVKQRF